MKFSESVRHGVFCKCTAVWFAVCSLVLLGGCRNNIVDEEPIEPRARTTGKPRVIILTDITTTKANPDDHQSMIHALLYSNEMDIEGIIPNDMARGVSAVVNLFGFYEHDYDVRGSRFEEFNYPTPEELAVVLQKRTVTAIDHIIFRAHRSTQAEPLYVLVWGDMWFLKEALFKDPAIADKIRVISVASGLQPAEEGGDCTVPNKNGAGGARNEIFNDPRFNHMWWLEIDWSYYGMYTGQMQVDLLENMRRHGALGYSLWEAVEGTLGAGEFRAGDTASVLYLIDPNNDRDDPTTPSWGGRYFKPFGGARQNYWTGIGNSVGWNYDDPCQTWSLAGAVFRVRRNTVAEQYEVMSASLVEKINKLYQ